MYAREYLEILHIAEKFRLYVLGIKNDKRRIDCFG